MHTVQHTPSNNIIFLELNHLLQRNNFRNCSHHHLFSFSLGAGRHYLDLVHLPRIICIVGGSGAWSIQSVFLASSLQRKNCNLRWIESSVRSIDISFVINPVIICHDCSNTTPRHSQSWARSFQRVANQTNKIRNELIVSSEIVEI